MVLDSDVDGRPYEQPVRNDRIRDVALHRSGASQ